MSSDANRTHLFDPPENITDAAMSSHQRISLLERKIQELRKTYNMIKSELASIDRRRKKLKRREREIKKVQKQMQSTGSASNPSQASTNAQSAHTTWVSAKR